MITPEEFPYIKSLHVNDCYVYQHFDIMLNDYKPFSHLILTGKNGSGKSTILHTINYALREGPLIHESYDPAPGKIILSFAHKTSKAKPKQHPLERYSAQSLFRDEGTVYAYFKPAHKEKPDPVETVIKDDVLDPQLATGSPADSAKLFKQYLVNRKVAQAFGQINNQNEFVESINGLFDTIKTAFNSVFDYQLHDIVFEHNGYEFYLLLTDGRRLTFDVLSDGATALISILMDLFIRVDIIRKHNDYSYNPCGIVLIDEPETHLHLELQEQVLPLLTSLFPNIQFIVATHSPAVIASIKNATIFDLTTKESRNSEETVGRSYSDLMMSHFGLNNEYSAAADAIINQVNNALNTLGQEPAQMKTALQTIYNENSDYLSPTLKVELELLIAQHEAQQIAHQ